MDCLKSHYCCRLIQATVSYLSHLQGLLAVERYHHERRPRISPQVLQGTVKFKESSSVNENHAENHGRKDLFVAIRERSTSMLDVNKVGCVCAIIDIVKWSRLGI